MFKRNLLMLNQKDVFFLNILQFLVLKPTHTHTHVITQTSREIVLFVVSRLASYLYPKLHHPQQLHKNTSSLSLLLFSSKLFSHIFSSQSRKKVKRRKKHKTKSSIYSQLPLTSYSNLVQLNVQQAKQNKARKEKENKQKKHQ